MTHDTELLRRLASIPRKQEQPLTVDIEPPRQIPEMLLSTNKLQILQDGEIHFEGSVDERNSDFLERALITAEYYKQQAQSQEQHKFQRQQQRLDSVYVSFIAGIFMITSFLSYALIGTIRGNQLLREVEIQKHQTTYQPN